VTVANRLWIGSLREGLHLVKRRQAAILKREQNPSQTITALFEDSKGRIWIGSDEGIYSFEGKQFKDYRLDEQLQAADHCLLREESPDRDDLGGGIMPGLVRLEGDTFRHVPDVGLLPQEEVGSLLADADGTLWIGTSAHGLACHVRGRFFHFPRAGLRATSIGGSRRRLWLPLAVVGTRHPSRTPPEFENVMSGSSHEIACHSSTAMTVCPRRVRYRNQPTAVKDARAGSGSSTARASHGPTRPL